MREQHLQLFTKTFAALKQDWENESLQQLTGVFAEKNTHANTSLKHFKNT
jgi:hypothetical protein